MNSQSKGRNSSEGRKRRGLSLSYDVLNEIVAGIEVYACIPIGKAGSSGLNRGFHAEFLRNTAAFSHAFEWQWCESAIIAEAPSACRDLRYPQKAFIFLIMSFSTQALAVIALLLSTSLLLAGLLLRASAK